jgi:nicotinamide mononucleotide transporter PnuC
MMFVNKAVSIIKSKKEMAITTSCIAFSIIFGFLSNDLWIGGTILATGLIGAYYASEGKRINYILGLINYLLMAYVAYKNHLHGILFFYTFIFAPLQVIGFFSWKKQSNADNTVNARRFTLKTALFIMGLSIVCSFILGYLLSLIPNQQLSYLDASTNCINLFGVILMIMRYQEAFWLWLVNNILDLILWTLVLLSNGEGAFMMFCASAGFLFINIYGIIKWHRMSANNDLQKSEG